VIGRVGTCNTSQQHGILGELERISGTVAPHGSVAHVLQQPWVHNASFDDNITFGDAFEPKWYTKVVKACALTTDIAISQDSDRTLIGDKRVSLWGGQKARLALARAVYADRDIVLLNDYLLAVDAHADKHIF
ncbi:P-loop containing nucleoside triphosphate hydrolase protein, partial [Blastocladiella britannica]